MDRKTPQARQLLGCGYELPAPAELQHFVQRIPPLGCDGELTACPGYTTSMPEVIEIARARLHWKNGALRDFTEDAVPTTALICGIEVLEGAYGECQAWSMRNPEKDA